MNGIKHIVQPRSKYCNKWREILSILVYAYNANETSEGERNTNAEVEKKLFRLFRTHSQMSITNNVGKQ